MKKLFLIILLVMLCGCDVELREDYYVFSFDDFTVAPGYDHVDFMRLVFDVRNSKTQLESKETEKDIEVYFWDDYMGKIDIENEDKKPIGVDDATVTRYEFYLDNIPFGRFKINDIELSESVKENCAYFNGEYIERNGYACAFGQKSHGKDNVVILYGDILAIDQDKLSHLEIYVK
ncbi:MAG: hypothetical protein IKO97_08820 [Erysipelotrichaceae bacterium]|jgi:hypothetical protein|nr:hypothetical protein [Erysipelotrichaceae bacterium]MCR5096186.1 hypothetical protein [Erysipelotrichaceae bacterium]